MCDLVLVCVYAVLVLVGLRLVVCGVCGWCFWLGCLWLFVSPSYTVIIAFVGCYLVVCDCLLLVCWCFGCLVVVVCWIIWCFSFLGRWAFVYCIVRGLVCIWLRVCWPMLFVWFRLLDSVPVVGWGLVWYVGVGWVGFLPGVGWAINLLALGRIRCC